MVTAADMGAGLFVLAVADETIRDALMKWYPELIPAAMLMAAVMSFVRNHFRDDVKNY